MNMLEIRAISYNDFPLVSPVAGKIPAAGGTVGRTEDNIIVLPDPMKAVSRVHLRFDAGEPQQDKYSMTNISSSNPVFVNDKRIEPGMECLIEHGDKIYLGGYILEALYTSEEKKVAPRETAPAATPATTTGNEWWRDAKTAAVNPTILDPTKLFGEGGEGPDLSDFLPPEKPARAANNAAAKSPRPKRASSPRAAKKSLSEAPPVHVHPPETTAPLGDADSPEAHGLYAAFLEGLGIERVPGRVALDQEIMKHVGRLLRYYVQGSLELIAGRAAIKQEVRANITVIAPRDNNPLKFSPDINTALLHMLEHQVHGFMESDEAVREVFIDLRAHQIGIVSGMQSALDDMLDSLDPETISANTEAPGVLAFLHKFQLWDAYKKHYQQVRENAENHLGDAFRDAYEQAIKEMRSKGRDRS
jgi:FHA domain-containing protein/type VI secretion system protein